MNQNVQFQNLRSFKKIFYFSMSKNATRINLGMALSEEVLLAIERDGGMPGREDKESVSIGMKTDAAC